MDTLIAAAIHDAKNGLTALNTWLAAAEHEHPSPAITQAREVAARVGAQLVELLALYRDGEGSLRLVIDDHDLTDFCTDVLAELASPACSGVCLETQLETVAEIGAWAFDAYQIRLVLLDALRNALRHANSRVNLRVALTPAGSLCFEVADDGPGFPEAILSGSETPMNSQSSGLGLRFARLIAQHHVTPDGQVGRIELSNQQGARFVLNLP